MKLGTLVVILISFLVFLLLMNPTVENIDTAFVSYDYLSSIKKTDEELPREGRVVPTNRHGDELDYELVPNDLGYLKKYRKSMDKYTYMAPGIDNKYRPANSYLVGYAPFETDKLWVPLVALATRLKYKKDFPFFSPRQDAWQTSRQAYRIRKGDCEDHSILLADWYIEMGYDARVVVGTQGWTGHAWVVLFKDGKKYLLEATKKDTEPSFKPIRNTLTYQPSCMFNRDSYWVNSGGRFIGSYGSRKWRQLSRFEADESDDEMEW